MKQFIIILITMLMLNSCSDKKTKVELSRAKKDTVNQIITFNKKENSIRRNSVDNIEKAETLEPKNNKHKEIPPDGIYLYDIAYAEWQGRSMGEKVKVIIKGNTIKIIAEGKSSMGVKNGELIDKGILVKHNKTGDWLITDNPLDANLEAYGGCAGAPMVIDFKNKKYWTC